MSTTEELLRNAVAAYQIGRFSEAEIGFKRVLKKAPSNHLALSGLALLSVAAGAKAQAIDYLRDSLKLEPNVGLTWNLLGTLYVETAQPLEAKAAFTHASQLSPEFGETWYHLAHCLIREGDLDAATQLLRRALNCLLPEPRAFESLTNLLCRQGRLPEAVQTVTAWLAREPANPIARHTAACLRLQDSPARAPDEYVRAHFDAFAEAGFDAFIKTLRYRGPELVAAALRANASRFFPVMLDAGCGTGLCGPQLRRLCEHLIGVDLSPKMLQQAQQRGCYDELVTAELGAFMSSRPRAFDAIVCADTFIYFGTLAEPLAAACASLRVGAPLVFTVEALPADDPADHRLGVMGRYQHSEAYLRRALGEAGFLVESVAQASARQDVGKNVPGYLVVARCGAAP